MTMDSSPSPGFASAVGMCGSTLQGPFLDCSSGHACQLPHPHPILGSFLSQGVKEEQNFKGFCNVSQRWGGAGTGMDRLPSPLSWGANRVPYIHRAS